MNDKASSSIQFKCKCGHKFSASMEACIVLFLDMPLWNGQLAGNTGYYHACPKCGAKCSKIEN